MLTLFHLFTYPPIIRGFLVLIVMASVIPITGVWVLRMNLLPYRFMLMHGALLGGVIALALNISPVPMLIVILISLILLADFLTQRSGLDAGIITIFLMTTCLGTAMALIYSTKIPAQNALILLWGNLFAISLREAIAAILFCLGLLLFSRTWHLQIQALIFDRDVAHTCGVDEKNLFRILLMLTGVTIAFTMRIAGALLMDSLLLIPVILASLNSQSLASIYKRSAYYGFCLGVTGFFTSLATDLPVGASTSIIGALMLAVSMILRHIIFTAPLKNPFSS
ncbi:MAG: hypothetical protein B0D92_08730 [Spirochaeta sp. LUC14_002_19_P3]|nr:MAG: hypothetical protein B0D92_08730 [Spirochaeta sp. LUC14_002_19_P3]